MPDPDPAGELPVTRATTNPHFGDTQPGTARTRVMAPGESSADPAPIGVVGDFELLRVLGRGGMGVVYEAREPRLGRRVALKLMLRATDQLRERFAREARALALVDSPHVVRVHRSGAHGEDLYFAMEFVEGHDLARRLERGWRPTHAEALGLILQAARGLAVAGDHGLIHRDIKPGNLMLANDGTLKLMDFGLVRMSHEESLTQSGVVMGTVNYFSPEQGMGHRCDARSDLYSLGVVFYELLLGDVPFHGESAAAVIYQHVHAPPVPPRRLDPTIPRAYEDIVLRCLAKRAADRYPDARALIADLERARDGGAARIRLDPRRALAAAAILAAAIAVGGGTWVVTGRSRAHLAAPSSAPISPVTTAPTTEPATVRPTVWAGAASDAGDAIVAAKEKAPSPIPGAADADGGGASEPAAAATARLERPEDAPAAEVDAGVALAAREKGPTADPTKGRDDAVDARAGRTRAAIPPAEGGRTGAVVPGDAAPAVAAAAASGATVATTPAAVATPPSAPAAPAPVAVTPPAAPAEPPAPVAPGLGATAKDECGYYADLVLDGATQRFRWCPPGAFVMGSSEAKAVVRGEAAHRVVLTRGFWIADTETTIGLWARVMGEPASRNEQIPVHGLTRDRCVEFAAKLAARVPNLRPRLPTDAEWEYACRAGGAVGADARVEGNYDWSKGPKPVRSSGGQNAWGLWDCIGNVAEWCADAYTHLGSDPATDPRPAVGDRGLSRGGCWEDSLPDCRPASRRLMFLDTSARTAGLRLALDGESAASPREAAP